MLFRRRRRRLPPLPPLDTGPSDWDAKLVGEPRPVLGNQLKLSAADRERLAAHRRAWQEQALLAGPSDRKAAEQALRTLYQRAGLPEPEVRWCASPPALLRAQAALDETEAGASVWHTIGQLATSEVWQAMWKQLPDLVGVEIWAQLRGLVWEHYWRHYQDEAAPRDLPSPFWRFGARADANMQVAYRRSEKRAAVWSCLAGDSYEGRTREFLEEHWWACDLLPTFSFCAEELGLEGMDPAAPLIELARSAGPWVAHQRLALICERPNAVHRDERGRLNRDDGPAIAWRDGEGFYFLQGRPIFADVVIAPEKLTVGKVMREQNVELRRIMIERMGRDRFFHESASRLVDSSNYGSLYDVRTGRWQSDRWLRLTNSTAEPDGSYKEYLLTVPDSVATAQEAVAWTFGLSADEYRLAAES